MMEILRSVRDYSQVDINTLFIEGETLIAGMAYLNDALHRLEQEYKTTIIDIKDELQSSHAEAKTRAETKDSYREYKKLRKAFDLADQHLMFCKKFKSDLGMEYRRT